MTAFLYPVTQPIKLYTGLDGKPLDGGYVYFGVANQNPETTPVAMYWDAAGTIPAAQPLRTVGGYITRQGTPANIYATGDFSVTVRDSNMALVFTSPVSTDLQLALSIAGATSAAAIPLADAGGYYTTDNVEAAFQQLGGTQFTTLARLADEVLAKLLPTGSTMDYAGTTAPTGWVLGSGRTIGSAASGATERANVDTLALYTLLWNSYTNTELVIQDSAGTPTTRGASASNDFGANKRLPLPDCRGRVRAGKDDMGGSAASRITAAGGNFDGTLMGKAGGVQNVTISEAQLPAHVHTPGSHTHTLAHTHTGPSHSHDISHTHTYTTKQTNYDMGAPAGSGTSFAIGSTTATSSAASTSTSGAAGTGNTGAASSETTTTPSASNTGSVGSGSITPVLSPTIVFSVIIKL